MKQGVKSAGEPIPVRTTMTEADVENPLANGFNAVLVRNRLMASIHNARLETVGQIADFRRQLFEMNRQLRFQALGELAEAESYAEALNHRVAAQQTIDLASRRSTMEWPSQTGPFANQSKAKGSQ